MRIKLVLPVLVFFMVFACYKVNKPKKPENLISKDKMVNILIDMALVSSAKGINKKKLESNGIVPDQYIFTKNNIDSLTFAQSNNYYAFNVDAYDAIYKRVKDSLEKLQKKYKKIEDKEKKEKKIKDSIKREKIKKQKLERKEADKKIIKKS